MSIRILIRCLLAPLLPWLLLAQPLGQPVGSTPFRRHVLEADRITVYVAIPSKADRPLPLVIWIQGTGCGSHFTERDGAILSGIHSILFDVSEQRAIVMAVEKPGVEYLDSPANDSDSRTCRLEFRGSYTLDHWANRIATAIREVRRWPGVDSRRTLVIGHSEGGIVAMRVSNAAEGITHAVSLAGGGPNYLFHMAEFMRLKGIDPEQQLYPCWENIRQDPDSASRYCWGQTHRQWSSFMTTSIIEEAAKSTSKLYFAHGTEDQQNPIAAFDVLRAEMAARRRAAVFDRIPGGSHSLDLPGQDPPLGFASVFRRVFEWFGL